MSKSHTIRSLAWRSITPLVAFCHAFVAVYAVDSRTDAHRIVIRMDNPAISVLDPVSIQVTYENHDDRPWVLLKPDSSAVVRIECRPVQDDATWKLRGGTGFYLGRIESRSTVLENGAKLTEHFAPDQREITIAPHGRYEFAIPLSRGRQSEFHTGPQLAFIQDEQESLNSNELKFHIALTRAAVDKLLNDVKDPALDPYERNWRSDWLEHVHPEPRLWTSYGKSEGEERKKIENERQARIRDYEGFWKKERDTPAMRKILEEINVANGVPLEIVRQLEERDDKAAKDASDQKSAGAGKPQEPIPVSSIPVPELPQVASRPASEAVPSSASSRPLWPMAAFFTAVAAAAVFLVRLRSSRRPA